MLLENYGSR
ncbi:unnamed protein product, partial [Allacma fusca]